MPPVFRALLLVTTLALAACSTNAQSSRQQLPTDVVATVGSTRITLAEVDADALRQPVSAFGSISLEQALYESRRAVLEQRIGDLLLDEEARAAGVDRATFVDREITSKIAAPTDADVQAWYQANPGRVQGAPLAEVSEPIRQLLAEERRRSTQQQFIDRLAAKTGVTLSLEPPRVAVEAAGRPARGPENAPVEIIEFSDFECPFCLAANPTVAQVLATYGDRIRFVYRHYTLPNHPNARPAAEASACAAEQGKFWQYHDQLFANQSRMTAADLKQHAVQLGLDVEKFNTCVDERRYQPDVDADVAAAQAAGVTGTPAFFINGRHVSGAQPFEVFKQIIDEELQNTR
jgi:protein-disulfide isomerase